jgi:hypothetical protein
MKVLIADNDRAHWDSLRRCLELESEIQLSGIAADAETSLRSVIARELRRILDGCPICDGGYRDHAYALLATLVMPKAGQNSRLRQFCDSLVQYRWQDLLCVREWSPCEDILSSFAFRCSTGRMGIVNVLSPANPDLPDNPLHYMILPAKHGKNLLALLDTQRWMPLRSLSLQAS